MAAVNGLTVIGDMKPWGDNMATLTGSAILQDNSGQILYVVAADDVGGSVQDIRPFTLVPGMSVHLPQPQGVWVIIVQTESQATEQHALNLVEIFLIAVLAGIGAADLIAWVIQVAQRR